MNKRTKSIGIYTTKTGAVDYMNVSMSTVDRHMDNNGMYENANYILWSEVAIVKCIKGFAL